MIRRLFPLNSFVHTLTCTVVHAFGTTRIKMAGTEYSWSENIDDLSNLPAASHAVVLPAMGTEIRKRVVMKITDGYVPEFDQFSQL